MRCHKPAPISLRREWLSGTHLNQLSIISHLHAARKNIYELKAIPAERIWRPLSTNTLTGGWSYISDPQWASYPSRFYRIRSP